MEKISENSNVVLIAQNPKSGAANRGKLVKQLADRLRKENMMTFVIQDIDELTKKAIKLDDEGKLRCVVSAGGDGTVSLLVNRLPPNTPFYVFPLGTANLLAKYLKSSLNIEQAAKCIVAGFTQRFDIGKANDQLFIVVASCGYDADVVHRIHSARKGHINYASYFWPVTQSIFAYRYPEIKLTADGVKLPSSRWAFIFNIPRYAVGLRFTPDANAQDGKLDICGFKRGGLWAGLGYFFSVLFHRHGTLASSHFRQFKKLELTSASGEPIPVELDGDPAGFTPVTIEIVPRRLNVIINENWQHR